MLTPYSIGFVELNYAIANALPFADIKNKSGKLVTATADSIAAAANSTTTPDDYRISITDASGEAAYPITWFTYLLVRKDAPACTAAKPLVHFLSWAFHDPAASAITVRLRYVALPQALLPRIEATLASLRCEGKPIA